MESVAGHIGNQEPRSPLWATAALTWIDNIGAFTALVGVFFVARSAYGFTSAESLGLGLLQGVTYVAGAMTAGRGSRALAGPSRRLSTRGLLVWMHVALAAICCIPLLWRSPWSMWLVVGLYAPIAGWLWPLVESFLSAGRSGSDLRKSSGWFNLSWASNQVVAAWALAPFMEKYPLWAMPVMGLSHLVALPLVMKLQREPAAHGSGGHAHDAAERLNYRRLLGAHRWMLIASYVVNSCLNPLLPGIIDGLKVPVQWATPLASAWTLSRVAMFWFMGQWGGWHGKKMTLVWPLMLLVTGVTIAMLAQSWLMLAAGLIFFGLGMGAIYSSAFYYAMEVGSAGVDAGGKHEALIGCGYTAGPILGLSAGAAAAQGALGQIPQTVATLALILSLIGIIAVLAAIRWRRSGLLIR